MIVIVIAISIIIKNIVGFLLRQSVHIKLPVRVTTGAHLDKKPSIMIEMKICQHSILGSNYNLISLACIFLYQYLDNIIGYIENLPTWPFWL